MHAGASWRSASPASGTRQSGDEQLGGDRGDAAGLEHAADLVGGGGDVGQAAEVLDGAGREDAGEAGVGEVEHPAVHVLRAELPGVVGVRAELPAAGSA
jgi:hypothetical protein